MTAPLKLTYAEKLHRLESQYAKLLVRLFVFCFLNFIFLLLLRITLNSFWLKHDSYNDFSYKEYIPESGTAPWYTP